MTEHKPTVAVQVVTWNGLRHIPSCLRSVEEQTYTDHQLLIIDNASIDGSLEWLRANAPKVYILRNNKNAGFARAHNQGFRLTKSPYVLCLNQDVVLDRTWLDKAVEVMESDPEVGMIGGRIIRYDYDENSLTGIAISDIVDTAGLAADRGRHVVDRESGWPLSRHQVTSGPVFGLSGACVLFRLAALESVRYQDEFFDEDFFAYKEDVDLAWRFHRRGWSAWYRDDLVAYHYRSIRGVAMSISWRMAQYYRGREQRNAWYSYRNHLLMLLKNERPSTFWPDSLWILWFEIGKFVFLLFTRPRTLSAWGDVFRLAGKMRRKGKVISSSATVPAGQVRQWFRKVMA